MLITNISRFSQMRIHIEKGLDIPIAGSPQQVIHAAPLLQHVGLCGQDYPGLKPRLLVAPGDHVEPGQSLFIDKRDARVKYTAPGAGTIVAVRLGPRRTLDTVVIRLEETTAARTSPSGSSGNEAHRLSRDEIVTRLADTGLWPAFRTRPFSRVPAADSEPHAIFVTAIDTQPLSPDPRVVIRPNSEVFHAGLRILPRLTGGTVWLCTGPDWDETDVDIERLQRVEFSGPHPAGLAGTHIHYLDPASRSRTVWHIGYQDVIALGKLFRDGELATERVIALAGDAVSRPRLIRARVGASIAELTAGQLREPGRCRRISGSMLSGRAAVAGESFLGRYHQQVSVLADADVRQVFGWPGLAARRYTASRTWLAKTGHRRKYVFSTAQNGRFSAMLPLPLFEKVLPLDILPSMLFRALMVTDTDRAQALGCLELDEEDLALCSFVCPAKSDYGAILRRNLDQIERHT